MSPALTTSLPLVLAAVMIASSVAKFRRPDDIAGWAEMGVPRRLRQRWLIAFHPWGELLLGIALAALGGVLGLLAAVVALALMVAYLWLVSSVFRRAQGASCACFGTRRPVTRLTIARNAWLTLLAAATVMVIWVNPLLGGAVAAADPSAWAWLAAMAVAVVTAMLIVWPEPPAPAAPASVRDAAPADGEQDVDYFRVRTPSIPVTLGDGETVNLRALASSRPLLILAVSETCGVCEEVIGSADEWRALLPEVEIRLLVTRRPEDSRLTSTVEPQTLHDPKNYFSGSIADWYSPTAVLLGADGMLAGGPETGYAAIKQFVEDIRASLDEHIAALTHVSAPGSAD